MLKDEVLKIAMLGHKHISSREGGVEIVAYELATRMRQLGHKVVAYDRSTGHVSGGTLSKMAESKGVKVVPVSILFSNV